MKKNYRAGSSKKNLDPPIITNMCIFRWFFDHLSKTTRTISPKSSEMVENIVRNNPWKFQVQEKSGSKDTSITVHPGIGYWVICCYALLLISHYRLKIWPWNFQEIIWALLWVESANKIFRFFCKKLFLTLTFASALFIQEHYKYVLLSDNIGGRCLEISWNALVTWCHAGIPAKNIVMTVTYHYPYLQWYASYLSADSSFSW